MEEIITNENEKNVKNNKKLKIIFLVLAIIVIFCVIIFIRYTRNHKPEKLVTEYLHYKYDNYSDYAKISNIRQIYSGNKKEGKKVNKDIEEYVFEFTANYLGDNSDVFYITLWVNTSNASFDIIEIYATKAKQEVYTGALWAIYRYDYPYTSLWDKICPVIVKDLIDDTIGENTNYQVVSNNEVYSPQSQSQHKYYFDIIVPIDIKTENSKTISIYDQIFTKLYNFDKETGFVFKFNDLEVKLNDYFDKYNNFEDFIKKENL